MLSVKTVWTTTEPTKEFSRSVGIRVARNGEPVPPLYHSILPPSPPRPNTSQATSVEEYGRIVSAQEGRVDEVRGDPCEFFVQLNCSWH
jgi:hypothetical protein